jgi:Cu/Ag efflux pump CusA
MIGGMLSSTLLTLLVIPAIYAFVKRRSLRVSEKPIMGEIKHAAE